MKAPTRPEHEHMVIVNALDLAMVLHSAVRDFFETDCQLGPSCKTCSRQQEALRKVERLIPPEMREDLRTVWNLMGYTIRESD